MRLSAFKSPLFYSILSILLGHTVVLSCFTTALRWKDEVNQIVKFLPFSECWFQLPGSTLRSSTEKLTRRQTESEMERVLFRSKTKCWTKYLHYVIFKSLKFKRVRKYRYILYNTLGAINFNFSSQYLQTVFQANIIVNNLGALASVCLPGPSKYCLPFQCKIRHYCSCHKKTLASKLILKTKKFRDQFSIYIIPDYF